MNALFFKAKWQYLYPFVILANTGFIFPIINFKKGI